MCLRAWLAACKMRARRENGKAEGQTRALCISRDRHLAMNASPSPSRNASELSSACNTPKGRDTGEVYEGSRARRAPLRASLRAPLRNPCASARLAFASRVRDAITTGGKCRSALSHKQSQAAASNRKQRRAAASSLSGSIMYLKRLEQTAGQLWCSADGRRNLWVVQVIHVPIRRWWWAAPLP